MRTFLILTYVALSGFLGWQYGGYAKSSTVLMAVMPVFSILAGVLVAVISIIGDPSMLLTGNWRLGYEHANEMQKRLARYSDLFALYLVIHLVIIAAVIAIEFKILGMDFIFKIAFGMSCFGILISIALPYGLMSIQKERMKEEIERRKANPGN